MAQKVYFIKLIRIWYRKDKKSIEGVKSVEPNFYNPDGHILLSKDKISKAYQDELNRKNELYKDENNNEYPLLIRGYSDEMLKTRELFIEDGKNLINVKEGDTEKLYQVKIQTPKLRIHLRQRSLMMQRLEIL